MVIYIDNQTIEEEYSPENFHEALGQIASLSLEEKLQFDPYLQGNQTLYSISLNFFKYIGQCTGISLFYIEQMFYQFCHGDPLQFSNISQLHKGEPGMFWRHVSSQSRQWKEFCSIALRCLTVATSEAEVERIFSSDRQILGLHGHNWKHQNLHHRTVIRTTTVAEIV